MSKISLELFGRDCEITAFEYTKNCMLVFEFTEAIDGYIQLGAHVAKFRGKECAVSLLNLNDGEHTPRLILMDSTVDLPVIIYENGVIYPKEHATKEIGELSLRERRLCRRVNELEERLDEISKKVFGSTIF